MTHRTLYAEDATRQARCIGDEGLGVAVLRTEEGVCLCGIKQLLLQQLASSPAFSLQVVAGIINPEGEQL